MGDRSYVSLWIYDIPQGAAEDVLEVLYDYGFETHGTVPLDLIRLLDVVKANAGDCFTIEEANLGTAEEVSNKLEDLGVTHQSHQDGKYEFSGDLHRFHPNLGRWDGDATNGAEAFVTDYSLRYKMKTTDNPSDILDWVKDRLGIYYEDSFRVHTGQKPLT